MSESHPQPVEVAREVFRQLAQQRKPPTPENYARAYARQAGVTLAEVQPAAAAFENLARGLLAEAPGAEYAAELRKALDAEQWPVIQKILKTQLARANTVAPAPPPRASKPGAPRDATGALKELLGKTVAFLVDERLGYPAQVVREVQALVDAVRDAMTLADVDHAAGRLRQFWLNLELRGEGPEPMIRGLHDLVRLMVRNMGDLVVDDQWVRGQVERIQALLDQPLSPAALQETQKSYKDFVYRQGTVKHSLDETATAIRTLTASVIERLGKVATTTGRFSGQIAGYSDQIRTADGLPAVRGVLERLLADTRSVHVEMNATHEELSASRDRVVEYEARVRALQAELAQMSELVREDALTGALNRRGLEQQLAIEQSRAERKSAPMCLAVLDIDNFKQLNDRLGHVAGDDALRHLARVVQDTLRPSDTLARYGGEEFVILLPDTVPEDGEKVMIRVQRELTKRFFLHNNERVLITFSAGIAARRAGEPQESLITRADRAMYGAKAAGKNRVQRAEGD